MLNNFFFFHYLIYIHTSFSYIYPLMNYSCLIYLILSSISYYFSSIYFLSIYLTFIHFSSYLFSINFYFINFYSYFFLYFTNY